MKRIVVLGLLFVVAAESVAIFVPDRRFVLWTSGVAVVPVMFAIRRLLGDGNDHLPTENFRDDAVESLQRWISRTGVLVRWSESTRAEWDRHLRPQLARDFFMATGQRQGKDPAALQAAGRMVFGDELWPWVDPGNIARTDRGEPGPGRAALDEILQRLERI